MNNENLIVVCITPIKNESWILDRFLESVSLWADHIIIADQNSTDNSREIALQYSKVILIENNAEEFNEPERQKLLIDKAREIKGKRVIIALDADEMLTSNFLTSPEWQTIINSPEGTIFEFEWVNILPDMKHCWLVGGRQFGYVDDGFKHQGIQIHSPRIPINQNSSVIKLTEIKILHYQYTNWERMESKHRWYQCWERVNNPSKSAIDIYRQYHHMYSIPKQEILPIDIEWIKGYQEKGFDITSHLSNSIYWWDIEILKLLVEYGCEKFRRENIWYVDWNNMYKKYLSRYGEEENKKLDIRVGKQLCLNDPRNKLEKIIHVWLQQSQKTHNSYYKKILEKLLKKFFGW